MARSQKARQPKAGRAQRRAARHKGRFLKVVGGLLAAAAVSGLAVWVVLAFAGGETAGPKTAAIVDQLSLSQPNAAFAEAATDTLEQAGYVVDYYPGEEVTVDFYSNLPTHGYDLIILRVHSGLARDYGQPTGYVSLFSGEPFSNTKYAEQTAAGLLGRAKYYDGSPEYFGIVPAFIESSMTGRFEGATIIMMGCNGLTTEATAQAFVSKGAKAVLGWSGRVSASHTDAATEGLLRHLLIEKRAMPEAVARTMAEVGPDPEYDTTLLYYP